jgi:release factor glutamine methyltransferase
VHLQTRRIRPVPDGAATGGDGAIVTAGPVHPQVYPVEEDSRLLLEAARAEVRATDRVLEVGTGSGRVAAALISRATHVVALDINPHAATTARSLGLEVVRSDLLAGIRGPFDLVLFNPPYLPTDPTERLDDWLEYALDGGPDGRRTIARFLGELDRILAGDGRALLLISSLTGPPGVAALASAAGLRGTVVLERRVEGETLMVLRLERGCADD